MQETLEEWKWKDDTKGSPNRRLSILSVAFELVVGGDDIIGVFEIDSFNFLSVFIAGSNVFKHRVQRRDKNGGGIHEGLGVQGNDGLP